MSRAPSGVELARPGDPALAGMTEIDPNVFRIKRPALAGYRSFVEKNLIVETYRSSAGQMLSCGELHRISINRTPHGRYAYRLGSNEFRSVRRPDSDLSNLAASGSMRLAIFARHSLASSRASASRAESLFTTLARSDRSQSPRAAKLAG